jgi:hypothetical protein
VFGLKKNSASRALGKDDEEWKSVGMVSDEDSSDHEPPLLYIHLRVCDQSFTLSSNLRSMAASAARRAARRGQGNPRKILRCDTKDIGVRRRGRW